MSTRKSSLPGRLFPALIPLLFLALSGCGYRGPLYLPEESPPQAAGQASPPPGQQEPADEDEGEDEEGEGEGQQGR